MSGAPDRVRLFVALELPRGVRAALLGWAREVAGKAAELRVVPEESLHVTLCFLGARPADEVETIARACSDAVAGLPAPSLVVGEAVWLPPRRPRVLAMGLTEGGKWSAEGGERREADRMRPAEGGERLATVQSATASALAAGGFYEPEHRPFLAHVTVARVRRDAHVRPAALEAPAAIRFTAGTVTLFASRLGQGPARYEALASETLAP